MTEEQLLKRALQSIQANAGNRSVVMYGRNNAVQKALENSGIKVEEIFTGNKDFLADHTLNCISFQEMKGKKDKYYVIVPFFLHDRVVQQRSILADFGYLENKDYFFYQEEPGVTIEDLKKDNDMLRSQLADVQNDLKRLVANEEIRDIQNKLLLWYAIKKKNEELIEAKKRFFLSMPKAEGTLRYMQLAGTILLAKLDEMCRTNDIPYWISFGTLLGAVRHQGFIPWDDDTDVCMMREDAEKLTKIMENDEDFYVSHIFADFDDNLNHCVQFKYRREGAPYCLDIFIYDYCNDISVENVEKQRALNAELAKEAQPIRKSNLSFKQKEERYAELMDKYLEISHETVGTTREPSKYMIWALDNYRCRAFFQGNCAISEVFPLKPLMFEGKKLMAPYDPEKYLREKYGDIYSLPNDMLSHAHFELNEHQQLVLAEILEQYSYIIF